MATAIAVGSQTLVSKYNLEHSSATVRNELAMLEEMGYLTQPHTSAGRVPTDAGYRLFVDELIENRRHAENPESAQRDLFAHDLLQSSHAVDDIVSRVSRILSTYTQHLAISKTPAFSERTVKKIELLSLAKKRVLFVLVTNSGTVLNRLVELEVPIEPEDVARVSHSLNTALAEKPARDIRRIAEALTAQSEATYDDIFTLRILDEILTALDEAEATTLRHGGFGSLLSQPEFQDSAIAQPLVALLEQGLDVMELLSDRLKLSSTAEDEIASPVVSIGHENALQEFDRVSIVAAPYYTPSGCGFVGVVGPTRMNYIRSMWAVRAAADTLTHITEDH